MHTMTRSDRPWCMTMLLITGIRSLPVVGPSHLVQENGRATSSYCSVMMLKYLSRSMVEISATKPFSNTFNESHQRTTSRDFGAEVKCVDHVLEIGLLHNLIRGQIA